MILLYLLIGFVWGAVVLITMHDDFYKKYKIFTAPKLLLAQLFAHITITLLWPIITIMAIVSIVKDKRQK